MDSFIVFLQQNILVIIGIHLVGVVLGFGGALVADILFIKFLRDLRVSPDELSILKRFQKLFGPVFL